MGTDENGQDIYHSPHEYTDLLVNIYQNDFLRSPEYRRFKEANPRSSISFGTFYKGATQCKCIRTPKLRACVDETEVNLSQMINVIKTMQQSNRSCECSFCTALRSRTQRKKGCNSSPLSSVTSFLDHVIVCPKIRFPCGKGEVDERIFRMDCCLGNCGNCNNFNSESRDCVFQCLTLFNPNRTYRWKEFMDHTLDNGNTIRELRYVEGDGMAFKASFQAKLVKYKKHFFIYRWLDYCRKSDIVYLTKNGLYIQADYSAMPIFDSQDKLNSQGHGVCVLSCWVVLHSPQVINYEGENGEFKSFTYVQCDHVRVVSPARGKGKDQDWFLHCRTFDFLINHYKNKNPNLDRITVWTDGAVTQYKCRQNFFYIAQSFRKHNIPISHKFAATAQFKGVHDKVGQVAKWTVR